MANSQMDLFASPLPYRGDPPAQRHSETSKAAAESVKRFLSKLEQKVIDCLEAHHPAGLTDEEMQEEIGMQPSTQRPRRIKLVEKGRVRDSGERRPVRSGRAAVVWELVP